MADEPPKRLSRPCPVCGTATVERDPEGRFRPFCSARCRQVDLGRWLSGTYVVPGEAVPDEEEG